jgi:hypothetical protein
LIHSVTLGIRNKANAIQGIKIHRTLMLYPDRLKKNAISEATKPTIAIKVLQPRI